MDGLHRKNQNLNLLIKDVTPEKGEFNVMDELDETISVNQDGAPRKKKLNTLLGGNQEADQSDHESEEEFAKIDIRVNAHQKFDIKQLKTEIWKIITTRGIPNIEYTTQTRNDKNPNFSFAELMVIFGQNIDNKDMLECLSVPQTFVCLLHLANENCLKFEKSAIHNAKVDGEELVFKPKGPKGGRKKKIDPELALILNAIAPAPVLTPDLTDFNIFIEVDGTREVLDSNHVSEQTFAHESFAALSVISEAAEPQISRNSEFGSSCIEQDPVAKI